MCLLWKLALILSLKLNSGALAHAKHTQRSTMSKKFGKLSIQENLLMTYHAPVHSLWGREGNQVSARWGAEKGGVCYKSCDAICATRIFLGGKSHKKWRGQRCRIKKLVYFRNLFSSILKGHSQLWDHGDLDTTFASLKSVYLNQKSNVCIGYI